jgi:hypothetical protein
MIQALEPTGVMMSNLFWLTEEQMERLKPFFPRSHGKPRVDDRRVLSGIIFINRNVLRCAMPRENMDLRRRSTSVGSDGGERLRATGLSAAANRGSSRG